MGEEFFLKFFGNIGLDNDVVAVALTRERASSMSSLSQEKRWGCRNRNARVYFTHLIPIPRQMVCIQSIGKKILAVDLQLSVIQISL
jgi:hypothetical protein